MRTRIPSNGWILRFFLAFMAAALPLLGTALVNRTLVRENEVATARAEALRVARQAAFLHQHVVDGSGRVLLNLARLPAPLLAEAWSRPGTLEAASGAHAGYTRIGVAATGGNVIAIARPDGRWSDVAQRGFFRRALGSRGLVGADFEPDPATGENQVTLAYPVLRGSGLGAPRAAAGTPTTVSSTDSSTDGGSGTGTGPADVAFVLFAVVDFGWFTEFVAAAGLPPDSHVAVLDETGAVVADESGARGTRQAALSHPPPFALLSSGSLDATATITEDGSRVVALERLRTSASSRPLYVAVSLPAPTPHADWALLVTFAGLLAAAGLAFGGVRRCVRSTFSSPVRNVTAAALRIARGDLAARLDEPPGPDEMKDLTAAFNRMADAIERRELGGRRDREYLGDRERALRSLLDEVERRVIQRTAELLKANAALQAEIAERIKAEEALRKFSLAIEQSGDSVFVTDANGVIEYANPAFEEQTGYERTEVLGHTPRVLKSGCHDSQFYDTLWRNLLNGDVTRTVLVNRRKDGQLYDEMQTISPIRDAAGKITHFVSTGRDITRHRRKDEALRRLTERLEHEATRIANAMHDEVGQFLTVAHTTLADVARGLPLAERARLEEVRNHLDKVEEQLRTLSRELRPRILDDLGLVPAVRFVADGVAKRSGLSIGVESTLEGRCPALVETAIYRLVQEGLTNVVRHARATRASVVLAPEAGGGVRCVLRDDGIGFDVAAVMSRKGQPNLGLVGIQDRVAAVGGTLEIRSSPADGTELVVVIPFET